MMTLKVRAGTRNGYDLVRNQKPSQSEVGGEDAHFVFGLFKESQSHKNKPKFDAPVNVRVIGPQTSPIS